MILHNYSNNTTYLEGRVNAYWLFYKDKILALESKQFKEEDYKGKSFFQWKSMQYYYLLNTLVLLVIEKTRDGDTKAWSYYYDKYKISILKTCLACLSINVDDALAIFDLPPSTTRIIGVESVNVEASMILEPDAIYISPISTGSIDLVALLTSTPSCVNNIVTDCVAINNCGSKGFVNNITDSALDLDLDDEEA